MTKPLVSIFPYVEWMDFQQYLLPELTLRSARSAMQLWPKLALVIGILLIVVPATLRIGDVFYVDNSTFTAIFAIGIIMIVIANNNRRRPTEDVRRTD